MLEVTFSHVYRLISILVYGSIFKEVFYNMNLLFGEEKYFCSEKPPLKMGKYLQIMVISLRWFLSPSEMGSALSHKTNTFLLE